MKVLVADDDKNLRTVLIEELSEEGHEVKGADSGKKALGMLEESEYDVILLDLRMPGLKGLEVLKNIKDSEIPTEVIILTGNTTVSAAVETMKLGAYDYLTKPFKLDELKAVVEKAYDKKQLLNENLLLKTHIRRQSASGTIITTSPVMLEVLETIRKAKASNFPVLIYGESGVGKELVAKAVHEASDRSGGPFIALNCGAIPENMLESELFGHEKGAFTGAHKKKLGFVEIAHNGSLFLDEIGELSLAFQGKLLRVIETGSFFRVGGTREVSVDVKFISATNIDIKDAMVKGNFRADLYYRVSALTFRIPPLRERIDDIPLLVGHFMHINPMFKGKKFSKDALEVLIGYSWPGNVRELQNVLHRALLLSRTDVIKRSDLPSDLVEKRAGPSGKKLEDMEKAHILNTLEEVRWQRSVAAEILGINTRTLYRKLKSFGIEKER